MRAPADTGVGTCWRPILAGTLARQALQAVDAIVQSAASLSPGERDASLAGGQAGLALMDAWTFRAGHAPGGGTRAWQRLDEAFDTVAVNVVDAGLYNGFTGVAWATDMVDGLLDPGGEDRNEEVDQTLLQLLSGSPLSYTPHDLGVGVTGIGVYALERYPRPAAVECLRYVVEQLHASARHDQDGIYWLTPAEAIFDPEVRKRSPSGRVDVGLAHGMGGTIALLGAICGIGIEHATARPLLEGAVSWLNAHSIQTEAGPTFPFWVAPGFSAAPARSAWCYGDPGLAAALLLAARGMGDAGREAEAVGLACRAAERPEEDTGVVDAGFCHGTAGLAHVYNRMYQATGEPALRRAAVNWLERTLEFCRLAVGRGASWVQGSQDPREGPWTGLDIVGGAAGVALVLLAAATPLMPAWDAMFLVSTPHPGPVEVP